MRAFNGFILFLSATLSLQAWAVDCTTTDPVWPTQAQVDAFQSDCDTVTGTLSITGSDITNLTSLSNLISVGNLSISDADALAGLDGLSGLTSVGGTLFIVNNGIMTNINALSGVTSVGEYLEIAGNGALTNLDGLSSLTDVGDYVDITNNDALTNLDGLSNLVSVSRVGSQGTGLYVFDNAILSLCSGLIRLVDSIDDGEPGPDLPPIPDVRGEVVIQDNLPGCNSLEDVHGLPVPGLSLPAMALLISLMMLVGVTKARRQGQSHRGFSRHLP